MTRKTKSAELDTQEGLAVDASLVLESVGGFFAAADRINGQLLQISGGVCTALGLSAKDCLDHPEKLLRRFTPESRLRLIRSYRQGREEEWETSVYLPDKTRRCLRIKSRKIPDSPRILLFTATDITKDREYHEEILRTNRQLQELSSHLQQVREEERRYIAREIHDELGQLLTAAKMEAYLLQENTAGVTSILDKALSTVRALSSQLRPTLLDRVSLTAAIREELSLLEKRTDLAWEFHGLPPGVSIPESIATNLFRIVQEALTNTIRHGEARRVYIRLQTKEEALPGSPAVSRLLADVSDDGRGIPSEKITDEGSFGLMGMRERARSCGGTLDIRRRAPHGTRIHIEIPLQQPPREKTG